MRGNGALPLPSQICFQEYCFLLYSFVTQDKIVENIQLKVQDPFCQELENVKKIFNKKKANFKIIFMDSNRDVQKNKTAVPITNKMMLEVEISKTFRNFKKKREADIKPNAKI